MTEIIPGEAAFAYERSQMPSDQYMEPALYWLDQIHTGQAPNALTSVVIGEATLRLAILPPVRPRTLSRLVIVSSELQQPDELYEGRAASHHITPGPSGCFHGACGKYVLLEKGGGVIGDPMSSRASGRYAVHMGVGLSNGLPVRAEFSALLREVATGGQVQDVVTDQKAYGSFLETVASKKHELPDGLLGAVIVAHAAL
jgi:hypothetical protein